MDTEDGEKELTMMQNGRSEKEDSYLRKLNPISPLVTGQRIIDTFFPVTKGGWLPFRDLFVLGKQN